MKSLTIKMSFAICTLLLTCTFCPAQDSEYLKLWNKYVDECSEIVKDTLTEKGVVTYEISPKDGDMKLIPKDTVWNEIKCQEYKENNWYSGTGLIIGSSNDCITYTAKTSLGVYSVPEPSKSKFETEIKRTKICNCKLREPTKEDFWEWLKINGYRK